MKRLVGLTLLLAAAAQSTSAVAQSTAAQTAADYPSKPIRIVVPLPPGGPTDVVTRLVAGSFEKRFRQPIVIDNRPGASGQLGTDAVVKSPADGYTLLVNSIGLASEQVLNKDWPIRFERDLSPIGMFAGGGYGVAVNPNLPVKTLAELVAYTRANPGKLNQAEPGGISSDMAILKQRLQFGPVESILYKGGPPAAQAVITGEAHFVPGAVNDLVQFEKAGKMRILAYTESARHPLLPHVPTVNEAMGIGDFDAAFWFLLAGPAGLPRDLVTRLNVALQESMRDPEVAARTAGFALRPLFTTPEEARSRVLARIKQLESLVAAGVKLR